MAFDDYGFPTNASVCTLADNNFQTHYVYSEADDVTKEQMILLELDCGHGHMGSYRKCSSCRKTMCEKCWLRCDEPVIKDLLSADVCHVTGTCWVNTCNHCREVNPNTRCPAECLGRQKFSIIDGAVFAHDAVFICDCQTCMQKQTAYIEGEPLKPTRCKALRGYEADTTHMMKTQFPDLHMCRKCFQSDFFGIVPMPWRRDYKVLFRASAHHWRDVNRMTVDPAHRCIHFTKLEWAAIHVGRHHSCHWPGHTCEMLSTSLLCSEAVRRLGDDRCLQVICIPQDCWDSGVVDFSSRTSMENYGVRLAEHLDRHNISPRTLKAWALRFREVVVDMRAVRAGRLHEHIIEFEPDTQTVQELKRICREAAEFMHVDSSGFLRAERECRSYIARGILPS